MAGPGRSHRGVWAGVFAGIAVIAVTAGLAPEAVAAPTVSTSATVTLSASTIAPGGTARVTGTLRAGSSAISGAAVVLQQRVAGTAAWHAWRAGTTDASGRFAATTGHLVLSRDFRMHLPGTRRYLAASSARERVTVQQWVTVLARPSSTPIVGSALVFSGTTSGGLVGNLVHLQLAGGTSWSTVATAQVRADGTYAVTGRATAAGSRRYRVQVDGKPGAGGVATFPSLVTVSAWYYLSDLPVVTGHAHENGSATTGGTTYYHAVRMSPYSGTASASYALSYRCSRFRSTTGTTDASKTALTSHNVVALDDLETAQADTPIGHPHAFDSDISGSFRLTLSSAFASNGVNRAVGWGDARILCAGRP